ncbi:MAG: NYN domain-containing protein [Acidimicrobiaceae bacterium]|nr:NYN domain-containing protein [Acidimicrobiaceae bacterium]MYC43836.1 NYN domain-containing protein [Acidimicrobiaceae bacterium]
MSVERVAAYIDGFNLYHGLIDASLLSSRWLDLRAMCTSLLKPHQQLDLVRYFTTRVSNDPAKQTRQGTYLDALTAHGGVDIDYGHFLSKTVQCKQCGNTWQRPEEKKTDVNIAVRLLDDAYDNLFDVAFVVSGDSDLVPPIESARRRHPEKTIIVAFPPKRRSAELSRVSHAAFPIRNSVIRKSRLPDPVVKASGHELHAPHGWLPKT